MSEDRNLERDRAHALVQATGLVLPDDELQRLTTLYERFATDRASLTGASPGESEPVTIFQASRRDNRP